MRDILYETVPVLDDFAQVIDPSMYVPLPDDWCIGVSDVVNSSAAIKEGLYKSVNLAGAGTISAVANELEGELRLFIFYGDGARFAVPPNQAERAADALSRVAMWAKRDLDLELRTATISVAEVRAAGFDVRTAFWQASSHVHYAMFMGGGLEWAEAQLKNGSIKIEPASVDSEPNLTGLSCQWGPIESKQGKIMSLIVKPIPGVPQASFVELASQTIALLDEAADINPVPSDGPDVKWPTTAIGLQSRVARKGRAIWWRRMEVTVTAALIWLVFKLGIRIAGFDPSRYRREMGVNTDFRKFDDSLMMTVDCAPEVAARLRDLLDKAVSEGTVRYGLHMQDKALMTCIAPSVQTSGHMHFVDGADGGYTAAAKQLR
jgi:hypothetical protein